MTDKEILEKTIIQAIKNGWKQFNYVTSLNEQHFLAEGFRRFEVTELRIFDTCYGPTFHEYECSIKDIIFNIPFAKAFWGEELNWWSCCVGEPPKSNMERWQYHLQQMVIEKNPLKYLEKFL